MGLGGEYYFHITLIKTKWDARSLTKTGSYGNAIKDATGAAGTRKVTGSNPLGLAGQRGTWAPSAQRVGGGQSNTGSGTASNPLGLK